MTERSLNIVYALYMLGSASLAAFGYFDDRNVVMIVGLVLFIIGLLRFAGSLDDIGDLF